MDQTPVIVLDDDPTGTQLVADVPVLLNATDVEARNAAFAGNPKAVHVVTNARALAPHVVTQALCDTLGVLDDVAGNAPVLLRGDSTLRAHLLEEYEAVCVSRHGGTHVPLLLVPALPSAGRITVDAVHSLIRDGVTVALDQTEYATDGVFAYTDAHLLRYAQQRSEGFFDAHNGVTCSLQTLEQGGAQYVCDVLTRLEQAGKPAVFAPDISAFEHLEIVSDGLWLAYQNGVATVTRAAPAFAAVHTDTRANKLVTPAKANGIIMFVGSYVPTTTRQLAHLTDTCGITVIVADVIALAADDTAHQENVRLAAAIDVALDATGLAVVATPRKRPETTVNLASGERIATNFAKTLHHVTGSYDTVIAKGGITATLTAQIGLQAHGAHVIGPAVTGVAQWQIAPTNRAPVAYFVVPGNVGDDSCLTELVGLLKNGETAKR